MAVFGREFEPAAREHVERNRGSSFYLYDCPWCGARTLWRVPRRTPQTPTEWAEFQLQCPVCATIDQGRMYEGDARELTLVSAWLDEEHGGAGA